jgi:hypothetical protein
MKAWCAAGRLAGLPCGSKHSMDIGRRQPCTVWILADNSNSNWWQLAYWSRQVALGSGLEPGGSPLQQQSSPS